MRLLRLSCWWLPWRCVYWPHPERLLTDDELQIYWGAAGVNVAAVVVTTVGLDVFRQLQQVSLTTSVVSISASMRARLNSVLILSVRL